MTFETLDDLKRRGIIKPDELIRVHTTDGKIVVGNYKDTIKETSIELSAYNEVHIIHRAFIDSIYVYKENKYYK